MQTHTFTINKLAISAASNASPVELTAAAHGMSTGDTVTISGATVAWVVINGDFAITRTGANTFTIDVDTTSIGALAGSPVASQHKAVVIQTYCNRVSVYENARASTTDLLVRAPHDDNTAIQKLAGEKLDDFVGYFHPGDIVGYVECVSAAQITMAQVESPTEF